MSDTIHKTIARVLVWDSVNGQHVRLRVTLDIDLQKLARLAGQRALPAIRKGEGMGRASVAEGITAAAIIESNNHPLHPITQENDQ